MRDVGHGTAKQSWDRERGRDREGGIKREGERGREREAATSERRWTWNY